MLNTVSEHGKQYLSEGSFKHQHQRGHSEPKQGAASVGPRCFGYLNLSSHQRGLEKPDSECEAETLLSLLQVAHHPRQMTRLCTDVNQQP